MHLWPGGMFPHALKNKTKMLLWAYLIHLEHSVTFSVQRKSDSVLLQVNPNAPRLNPNVTMTHITMQIWETTPFPVYSDQNLRETKLCLWDY